MSQTAAIVILLLRSRLIIECSSSVEHDLILLDVAGMKRMFGSDQNRPNVIKSADSPAQLPSSPVLMPNTAPGDQNTTNLIKQDIAATHKLESGSVPDHKLSTNASTPVLGMKSSFLPSFMVVISNGSSIIPKSMEYY